MNMDFIIKEDPDYQEPNILSCVILKQEFSDQNSAVENAKNVCNKKQKASKKIVKKISPLPKKVACNKEINELPLLAKKSLLKFFKQHGCSQETLQNFVSTYSVNTQLALEYFEKAADDAQGYVYQECDSLSFNNITKWLKYFEAIGAATDCNYEAAIILNAIANNETHPEPKSMDGVDLKEIYRFLSYALLGLPQEQLGAASAKFLSDEFQSIIDEANTDKADTDVRNMKTTIEDSIDNTYDGKINSESSSLDPLNISIGYLNNK